MTFRELQALVKQGEGQCLEFKKKVDHPDKVVREAVAFANTSGGLLLIGVDDNGTLSGLKYADEEAFEFEKAIKSLSRPALKFSREKIAISEKKEILVYSFRESRLKPHYAVEDEHARWGKAYVRVKDKSIQASPEMREILKGRRQKRKIEFTYGDKERTLMQLLEKQRAIRLTEYAAAAGIPEKTASETLVTMALANVIRIIPQENEDLFERV